MVDIGVDVMIEEPPSMHRIIAATQTVIERGEGLVPSRAFQPWRDAAEVHGERVLAGAVDAVDDHVADCLAQGREREPCEYAHARR